MTIDWKWVAFQAVIPLLAPVLVWFAVSACRSTLRSTPSLRAHMSTVGGVIEEYGWLTYAVFLSIQCTLAITQSKVSPLWMVWLNLIVLVGSLLIIAVAFFARFLDAGDKVTMKPSAEVQINRYSAGIVALAAAVTGYLSFSAGKVL